MNTQGPGLRGQVLGGNGTHLHPTRAVSERGGGGQRPKAMVPPGRRRVLRDCPCVLSMPAKPWPNACLMHRDMLLSPPGRGPRPNGAAKLHTGEPQNPRGKSQRPLSWAGSRAQDAGWLHSWADCVVRFVNGFIAIEFTDTSPLRVHASGTFSTSIVA